MTDIHKHTQAYAKNMSFLGIGRHLNFNEIGTFRLIFFFKLRNQKDAK